LNKDPLRVDFLKVGELPDNNNGFKLEEGNDDVEKPIP